MLRVVLAFGVVTLLSGATCISTIDGEWCAASGEQLSIKGPSITLPSKITLQGQHRLHAFSYKPLNASPAPGNMEYMTLAEHGAMNLYHVKDGDPGEAEVWQRCGVNS
jgi:hypothetical protein